MTCDLVSSFLDRQVIILVAGLMFLVFTCIRVKLRLETRDLRTFLADVAKQCSQQVVGGILMVAVGVELAGDGSLDSLAWYGATYPFELLFTTIFTWMTRHAMQLLFERFYRIKRWPSLLPYVYFGRYGPSPGVFKPRWFMAQLFEALVLSAPPS